METSVITISLFYFGLLLVLVDSFQGNRNIFIKPLKSTSQISTQPVVNGARQCGAPGKFLQWRMEDCVKSVENVLICLLPGDGDARRTEIDFIPSDDISELSLSVKILVKGTIKPQIVYSGPIANSTVRGGEAYTLYLFGGATPDLLGKRITAQYQLFREDSFKIELCTLAEFDIV